MSEYERTDRILERASRGEANAAEIEESIAATRADLDRNLTAIEQRLSPDELVHQAVGYLRDGPSEFLSNLGRTVKANPVPVALLSIGVGWLMFAGKGSRRHERADVGVASYGGDRWAEDVSYGAEFRAEERGAGGSFGSGIGQMTDAVARAGEAARDQARDLSDRASHLTDQAADLGHRVTGRISEVGHKMSDVTRRAQQAVHSARDSIARAGSTLGQQPRRLREGYQDLAEHHPFVLGAIAFVAGGVIAATLRRTQFEDETLGEMRDQALQTAEVQARSQLQKGVASVKSALSEHAEEGEEAFETEAMEPSSEPAVRDVPGEYGQDRVH